MIKERCEAITLKGVKCSRKATHKLDPISCGFVEFEYSSGLCQQHFNIYEERRALNKKYKPISPQKEILEKESPQKKKPSPQKEIQKHIQKTVQLPFFSYKREYAKSMPKKHVVPYLHKSTHFSSYKRKSDPKKKKYDVRKLDVCYRENPVFPCRREDVVFYNMKEFQQFLDLKIPGPYPRSKIPEIVKRANEELGEEKIKFAGKQRKSPKIRFK